MGWEVTLSWDYPRKYLGYKGILGYLDKGGGGGGSLSWDDPRKYLGYKRIPGYLDKGGGYSCLYPGMIPGSTWVTRESRDTWTRGGGGGGGV